MKIAIVCGIFFPEPGGAQVQTHNIASKIVELGHKVDFFIYNKTNIKNNNYNIIILNKFFTSLVFFFEYYLNINCSFILKIYLKKIIKKNKYDIWHFSFINFKSLIIINLLKQLNQKIIVTFHGADIQMSEDINYGNRLDQKYELFLLKTLKKIDLFLNISHSIKKYLLKLGVKNNKIIYLPNTIDLEKIKKLKILNKRKNIKNDFKTLKLITVARYNEKVKGYDLVHVLAKKLIKKKIKFLWTLIGKDTDKIYKFNFIKKNKNYFQILNNIDNRKEKIFPNSIIIKKYINSDLYINLSRIESFGVTLIEAMACDLPVISFNVKGANEIIKNNKNGFLVSSGSIDDFSKKIHDFYMNKNSSRLMKKKMYAINYNHTYDLKKITKKLIKIYNLLKNSKFNTSHA
jgi:glycosyltransferase involved in cell wall biosynthesis